MSRVYIDGELANGTSNQAENVSYGESNVKDALDNLSADVFSLIKISNNIRLTSASIAGNSSGTSTKTLSASDIPAGYKLLCVCAVTGTGGEKYIPRWWDVSNNKISVNISNLNSSTGTPTVDVKVMFIKNLA